VHEGGISSPWIMHWPAGIREAGKLRHNPCHLIDIVPTMIELAGGRPELPPGAPVLAGKSLVPALAKDNSVNRELLYFNHANNRAIRTGDYKLVAAGTEGPWELYDLRTDRAESKNLAEREGARVREMAARWKATDDELVRQRETSTAMPKTRI
jgi:arylsulfatase